MWNRYRPTRGSFWSAWKSPTSTRSTASRRRWRSGRRIRRAIRDRRWRLRPSFTIFCGCCGRARGARIALIAEFTWSATRWIRWPQRCWRSPKDRAGTRCFPIAQEKNTDAPARQALRSAQEGLQPAVPGRQGIRIFDAGVAARCRFLEAGIRAGRPPGDHAGYAAAAGGYGRDLLSRSGRGDFRAGGRRQIAALQRKILLQAVRERISRAGAEPVQLQQSVRRVQTLPGVRQHHRLRHGSGDSGSSRIIDLSKARWIRGPSRSIPGICPISGRTPRAKFA